jgi:hypothetical protein
VLSNSIESSIFILNKLYQAFERVIFNSCSDLLGKPPRGPMPQKYWRNFINWPFKECLKCIGDTLGNAQVILETL